MCVAQNVFCSCAWYLPLGQASHSVVDAANFPATHGTHIDVPALALIWPDGHAVQLPGPARQPVSCFPAAQWKLHAWHCGLTPNASEYCGTL